MSSESDTEEFYDAEESTPVRSAGNRSKLRKNKSSAQITPTESIKSEQSFEEHVDENQGNEEDKEPVSPDVEKVIQDAVQKAQETEKRQRRIEEMRRKMLFDDEENADFSSDQGSIASSSVEGIYPSRHILTPSIVKLPTPTTEDAQSVISLGKVGSILGGQESSCSELLPQDMKAPEPDVVASTKGERVSEVPQPVAPPRRKKKLKAPSPLDPERCSLNSLSPTGLPSPLSAVESITQELEHSLDLHSAIQGQYVVKPQDNEMDRAPSSSKSVSHGNGGGDSASDSLSVSSETQEKKTPSPHSTPEGSVRQLNMVMRTRSDSGRPLTDLEILEQVHVLNLDTGEAIPLSVAEEKLPQCINPLSLHIMRITSEYVSNTDKERESDEESVDSKQFQNDPTDTGSLKKRATRLKKILGKKMVKTVDKIKLLADERIHFRHSEEAELSDEEASPDARHLLKVKTSSSHKSPPEFDSIRVVQELSGEHSGAIWTMKFSTCGRLLATAGQDHVLRIWVLRNAYKYFDDMRQKYSAEAKGASQENLSASAEECEENTSENPDDAKGPFMAKPFCNYVGHTADLLDVSWSKNYFILSSSMDKTVRLWHISRGECLCCFQHIDFVTAIAFHPRDDRYFLSGSLDGKLRLWNIPDKKVALWNELDGQTKLITSANFCQNGKFAVVGSYDGRCIFYNTEQLKYYTQIHVRSTRGKNAQGRKISGIEPMPGEDKILVTSNDSRVRLYDLRDLSLSCKYKGYVNLSSQIKASFSHDSRYIISGSENQFIYIWKTYHDYAKFTSARRDRNDYWEGIKAHNAVVTAAVFAPNPDVILKNLEQTEHSTEAGDLSAPTAQVPEGMNNYVIISADFSGVIKVFVNRPRAKTTPANLTVGLPVTSS